MTFYVKLIDPCISIAFILHQFPWIIRHFDIFFLSISKLRHNYPNQNPLPPNKQIPNAHLACYLKFHSNNFHASCFKSLRKFPYFLFFILNLHIHNAHTNPDGQSWRQKRLSRCHQRMIIIIKKNKKNPARTAQTTTPGG